MSCNFSLYQSVSAVFRPRPVLIFNYERVDLILFNKSHERLRCDVSVWCGKLLLWRFYGNIIFLKCETSTILFWKPRPLILSDIIKQKPCFMVSAFKLDWSDPGPTRARMGLSVFISFFPLYSFFLFCLISFFFFSFPFSLILYFLQSFCLSYFFLSFCKSLLVGADCPSGNASIMMKMMIIIIIITFWLNYWII